jgi:coproporphyrinogen III oxidase
MKRTIFYLHTKLTRSNRCWKAVDGQAKFKEDLWNAQKAAADARVIENGKVLKRRCEYLSRSWEIARSHAKKC